MVKENKYKMINLPEEVYNELGKLKVIDEEPFHKVIMKIIKFYNKNKK